jgi:hypothetical protein
VRGGDDADYEAELLEGPACSKTKMTSSQRKASRLLGNPSHPLHPF